jgi:hypothetical protein
MRFLLGLTAAASLVACSHNHANVHTGPETGRVSSTDTVRTTGKAADTATAHVSGQATGTATDTSVSGKASGTATGTVDTTSHMKHDSM